MNKSLKCGDERVRVLVVRNSSHCFSNRVRQSEIENVTCYVFMLIGAHQATAFDTPLILVSLCHTTRIRVEEHHVLHEDKGNDPVFAPPCFAQHMIGYYFHEGPAI